MIIIGIGTDIVETARVRGSLDRFGERFVNKILCSKERRSLQGRRLAAYLARQFAAKEAVSKALGTGMRSGVHFRNIEVTRTESGAPVVTLTGRAKARSETLGISDIQVSISDERDYAIAYVIATGD